METDFVDRPFIKSPFLSKMIELFDSLRYKKSNFGVASCLILTGESGSGKSELAKYYVRSNPVVEECERTRIPVVHFELKAISTPLEFIRALLVAIGDPQRGLGARNQGDLFDRLVLLIKVTCIELLILDEIQVIIERRSEKVVTGIADIFKDLIKDTNVPIVFMGMPWSGYLVTSNRQLGRRIAYRHIIPPYRISQKIYRDDYRKLLKLLADAYGISDDLKLEELPMTLRCFSATNGNLASTSDLVCEAFMMSKMEGKKVSSEIFSDVIRSYGVNDECNPFLVPIDKLELRELIVHSDWKFGYRANKNSIIDAEYATYGVSSGNKIYSLSGTA